MFRTERGDRDDFCSDDHDFFPGRAVVSECGGLPKRRDIAVTIAECRRTHSIVAPHGGTVRDARQYFFISAGHTDGLFIVMGSDL